MKIPQLLIGTFQNNNYKELFDVVKAGVEVGFTGFDTAPSYGTEAQLGKAIQECATEYDMKRDDFYISDKIDAWQMQEGNGDITRYVENALNAMGLDFFDMLLIHWPIPEYVENTWKCFLKLKERKLTKEIGICNVRVRHLEDWITRDMCPNFIQIERHPLRICQKEMDYCHKHGITVMAYSPLCRMHPDLRNNQYLQMLSDKYKKNIGQIILRWQIETNAIPVFMSKKPNRIKENVEIFNFNLTTDEVEKINSLDQNYKIFLESWGCPGF